MRPPAAVVALVSVAACYQAPPYPDAAAADDAGAGADAADFDAATGVDAPPPPPHVNVASGWTVEIWRDFSDAYVFVANDWTEVLETYDNAPDALFLLGGAHGDGLGVIAGRAIIELPLGDSAALHDYGDHLPDTQLPDNLRTGLWLSDFEGVGPTLLVTSSSENSGDGVWRIDPTWAIERVSSTNNVRCVCWDYPGLFEGTGMLPTGYVGTSEGLRRLDGILLAAGDTHACQSLADGRMLVIRRITAKSVEVPVRIGVGPLFAEETLAPSGYFRLADGDLPPAPDVAWVIRDQREVGLLSEVGAVNPVAWSTDPAWAWRAAAVPPSNHALAAGTSQSVYVLEQNRAQGIDRVLRVWR